MAVARRARKEQLKRLLEVDGQIEAGHMRGLLADTALNGGDEQVKVRAAQAYLRETRSHGETNEVEPLYIMEPPPEVVEELQAQLALPMPADGPPRAAAEPAKLDITD